MYDEQDSEYVLGLEKVGTKKTLYYEQAFDDQTGLAKGSLLKVTNPDWVHAASSATFTSGAPGIVGLPASDEVVLTLGYIV